MPACQICLRDVSDLHNDEPNDYSPSLVFRQKGVCKIRYAEEDWQGLGRRLTFGTKRVNHVIWYADENQMHLSIHAFSIFWDSFRGWSTQVVI